MIDALGFLRVGYSPVYDVLRITGAITALAILLLSWWLRQSLRADFSLDGDRDRFLAIICYQVAVIFTSLANVGKPFTLYLLPLFLAGNFFILRGIAKRAQGRR